MSTEYNILAKVIIDTSTVDAKLKSYNPSIKVKVDGGTSANELGKLNTTVGTLQNKLEKLKISNVDAFRSQPIIDQYSHMENLVGAYSRGETSIGNVNTEMGKFENNIKRTNESVRTTTTSVDGLGTALGKAIGKIALWAVATTAIYGSLKQLQEGVQYVKDLNKVMTDVQIVAGYTRTEIQGLARDYNDLARATGTQTVEVAKGSLEWVRQGKTADETAQLLKASMMMSKLANMDSAQSTEYLTSMINGYKLSIDEVMPTIDKLVALDNAYATSVAEIAAAMQKVSAVSMQSNVSLEEMAAMITVVSSDLRLAPETIGQAWKTILMRMQNVKLGKFMSDEGEDISDVERVLSSLGVEVRANDKSWRDFSDVLNDTMVIWNKLGAEGRTVEQSMIANAFAGQRQANIFIDLMNNQEDYNRALQIEADALGLATERYDIYMNSIEAASNKMRTSWEKMWSTFISEDFIKYIINAGTSTFDFIDKIGGLNTILEITIALLIAFNRELIITSASQISTFIAGLIAKYFGLSQSIASATGATTAFSAANASAAATGGAVALAIFAVIKALQAYDQEVTQRQKAGAEQIASQWERIISTSKTTEEAISRITKAFEVQNNLLGAGQERKINIQSLNQALPALAELSKSYDEYYNAMTRAAQAAGYLIDEQGRFYTVTQYMGQEIRNYADGINGFSEAEWQAAKSSQMASEGIVDSWVSVWEQSHPNIEKMIEDIDALAEASQESFEKIESSMSSLTSIQDDYFNNGEISLTQAGQLIDMGYAEALMIDTKTGKIGINVQMLRQLVIASADAAAADAQLAYTASMSIAGHEAETAALYKKWQVMTAIAEKLKALPTSSFAFSSPTSSRASGGSSGISAQEKLNNLKKEAYQLDIKNINAQKKLSQQQIKNLNDQKKAHKEIIDAKKESLKLAKDESDFNKTLAEKNKDLIDIENALFAIQFDNSQEAVANRLKLEEEKAKKMEEIAQLQADRTYDIQIEALDREYAAFENMINMQIDAIEVLIDGFNNMIDKINEMIDALAKLATAQAGGGYAKQTKTDTKKKYVSTASDKAKFDEIARQYLNQYNNQGTSNSGTGKDAFDAIAQQYLNQYDGVASGGSFEVMGSPSGVDSKLLPVAPGELGIAINRSQQNSIAPLASFFNSILKNTGTPQFTPSSSNNNGVNMGDIVFQVSGNLDRSAIPDIKSAVFEVLNQTNIIRGKRANAFTNSI